MIVRFDDIGRFADHHCSNFHSIKNNNKHQKKTDFLCQLEFNSKFVKNKRSFKMNPAHK